jgi:hypothetical protein
MNKGTPRIAPSAQAERGVPLFNILSVIFLKKKVGDA